MSGERIGGAGLLMQQRRQGERAETQSRLLQKLTPPLESEVTRKEEVRHGRGTRQESSNTLDSTNGGWPHGRTEVRLDYRTGPI